MKLVFVAVLLSFACWTSLANLDEKMDYIVYMGARGEAEPHELTAYHHQLLTDVLGSCEEAADAIIFSYKHGFNGFSARMSKLHANIISGMPNVVRVFPSKRLELHTTRSWDFLGLTSDLQDQPSLPAGSYDPVVGVFDTGIWPESEAFNDTGFGPVPARWKGFCDNTDVSNSSQLFLCTKKVIGGRAYHRLKDVFANARDAAGHGTHTASTATGVHQMHANMFGLAPGPARGGYPKARVAIYKVCSVQGCDGLAVLAAFDDAIHDGVDVLSLSIGYRGFLPYDEDILAIGAYHAVENGITVSCSAGNFGPYLVNSAPWMITVGASTIDRTFSASVLLGNNVTLEGLGINVNFPMGPNTLISAGSIPSASSSISNASQCFNGSLDMTQIPGNIIVCILDEISTEEMDPALGLASGIILVTDSSGVQILGGYPSPTAFVNKSDGDFIFAYMNATQTPTATFLNSGTVLGVKPAPIVAEFSSRGPSYNSPDIIKPDVIAPGVNIIAAWSPVSSVTDYFIASGTSMSCPHVAGAVAYLKSIHPYWTPSIIKSALMTTASTTNNMGEPISDYDRTVATPFAAGSGQINPVKAADPGLVYEISPSDYIDHLCSSGYNATQLMLITGNTSTCSGSNWTDNGPPHLNYPSFGVIRLTPKAKQTFRRTVTNVGDPETSYTVVVDPPKGVDVVVTPSTLDFQFKGQQHTYVVTVSTLLDIPSTPTWLFGRISWMEAGGGGHVVQSPVAVFMWSHHEIEFYD